MSADVLKKMQDVIQRSDLLRCDVPVSIGFSTNGKIIVYHSIRSIPFYFDTVEMALKHIMEYIEVY